MSLPDLIIRGDRVLLPTEALAGFAAATAAQSTSHTVPAAIHIISGRIAAITAYDETPHGCEVVTAGKDAVVGPGLVDTHVHVNEPGRTNWEGFVTATRAAAAGGVTTIVDMPLNSIPATTSLEGLREKLKAAQGRCVVDVGFWGGVVPGNTHELAGLLAAGVKGFKCFLIDSGVEEFPNVTEEDLRLALPEIARLGTVLMVHAELPGPCEQASLKTRGSEPSDYRSFLESRPRAAENEAVELVIRLSREYGSRVHIVHHSSADALPALRQARETGVQITAETCPHYLFFAAEDIQNGATEFKCCPPIRELENQAKLWDALADGTIDMIVSDHSPCSPELKGKETGDFMHAWGGISSLQLRLPVIWSELRRRGFSLDHLVSWLCRAPAKLVGLQKRKGALAVGLDADVVIWKDDEEFRVEPAMLEHRHKLTPYNGRILLGKVQQTFLRGRKVYDKGEITIENTGRLLT